MKTRTPSLFRIRVIMKYRGILWVLPFLLFFSCATDRVMNDINGEGERVLQVEAAPPSPFVLGSGDEIAVSVWRNEDLKRQVQIGPSGVIYLPLVGEIKASGSTIGELREKITVGLSQYIVDPQVDINVLSVKSQKVHVLGEVKSPGTFALETNTMAWEAISNAGGFTTDADKKRVLLIRTEKDRATVAAINIDDMIKKGKITKEVYLRNRDIVYVLPSFIANVERFMKRFYNIINPLVTVERGIVLYPDARDVLQGKDIDQGIVVAP